MSDIIPPLISSSPPPLPEFDDDEDDDEEDDEFGMGSTIGELALDFPGSVTEKKDKILEIDRRRLELGAGNDGWKCEEQDSTSQDSGLCMASQGSEGMSPLPQSDDEDRSHDVEHTLKHSSTVMFNSDEVSSSSTVIALSDETLLESETSKNNVQPMDTGQKDSDIEKPPPFPTDSEHAETEDETEEGTDNQFGNWNGVSQNGFDEDFVVNSPNTNLDLETDSKVYSKTLCEKDSHSLEGVFRPPIENSVERDVCEIDKSSFPVSVNNEQVLGPSESELDNCEKCDKDNSSLKESFTEQPNCFQDVSYNMIDKNGVHNEDDDDDEDDFGNFESVPTIQFPDSTSDNVSVENQTGTLDDSVFNKDIVFSEEESYGECTFKAFNDSIDSEDKVDVSFRPESISSTSVQPETGLERSDEVKYSEITPEDSHKQNEQYFNDGDDDDDDFSDFTESSQTCYEMQFPGKASNSEAWHQTSATVKVGLEDIFPKVEREESDVQTEVLEKGTIWQHLCPLENSPALTFQWSGSKAHNKLLSALSIDSRNILFGPRWNSNIPRFAANLGTNPLQPVKAVETQSSVAAAPSNTSNTATPAIQSDTSEAVPDAIFDWVGSGLTNPLDCSEKLSASNIEELEESSKRPRNIETLKVLSSEAEKIISLLPDLNFMKKTYIEVLISKA